MAGSHRLTTVALVAIVAGPATVLAQPQVVFHGRPSIKVSEGALERLPTMLSETTRAPLEIVITEEDGQFFWASRQNTPMGMARGESFTTFVALNGSGYVRIKNGDLTSTGFPITPTEEQFDYVEHIPLGLNSVIYYGTRVDAP